MFANVTNDMTIAQEEVFGPVITLIGYRDGDDALRIGQRHRLRPGRRGVVERPGAGPRGGAQDAHRHGAPQRRAADAPFGVYKQSGNGREYAAHGLKELLEAKSIFGDNA